MITAAEMDKMRFLKNRMDLAQEAYRVAANEYWDYESEVCARYSEGEPDEATRTRIKGIANGGDG